VNDKDKKVRENRLRRKAARQGLTLTKSRLRDPDAVLYGTYMLIEASDHTVAFTSWDLGGGYGLTLDEIEDYLSDQ